MENKKSTEAKGDTIMKKEEFAALWKSIRLKVTDTYDVPPEILWVNGSTIGTLGNFSASTGKAKSKKTFNISAIVAAALTNDEVLHYSACLPPDKRKILYVDTEQSRYHCHKVMERILRLAGLPTDQDRDDFVFIVLREQTPDMRKRIIEYMLENMPDVGLLSYTFENFFFSSYILGNAYSENSCAVADDGTLLFGSNYGLVVVDPAVVVGNTQASPMVSFTNLHVNGIAVRPGDVDSPLEHAMIYTDKIELKHYQNSFVIDFSTFEYSMVNDIKYTYRLDNYDREWSALSSLNFAAYKNLDPGHYTLRVKACNGQGVWAEKEAVLQVVIVPPFWRTGWAFILYVLVSAVALYVAFRLVRNFNVLRNRIQVEKQLTEYKLVFLLIFPMNSVHR